jgi:hypothetical protein
MENIRTKSAAAILMLVVFVLELQLSVDQQKELSAIVDDTRAQIRAAYAPADAQREQLRQQASTRIRAILTPDQLPKFDAYRQRIDEQRKKATDRPLSLH